MSDPNKDSRVVSQKRQNGELSYEQGVNPEPEEPGLLSKQFYLFICIFLIKIFFKFISSIFNWRKSQQLWKGHTLTNSLSCHPSKCTLPHTCQWMALCGLATLIHSTKKQIFSHSFVHSLYWGPTRWQALGLDDDGKGTAGRAWIIPAVAGWIPLLFWL